MDARGDVLGSLGIAVPGSIPQLHPDIGWYEAFGEPKIDLEGAGSRIVLCVIH